MPFYPHHASNPSPLSLLQTDMENSVVVSDYQVLHFFQHSRSQSFTRVQQMDRILKEERKYIVDICQVRDSVFSVITVLHVVLSHAAQTTTSVIA